MFKSWEGMLALRWSATRCRKGSLQTYMQSRSLSYGMRTSRQRESAVHPSDKPSAPRREWRSQDTTLVQHLNTQFSPLVFPPELSSRILTHASHPDAIQSHNGRLSFVGRRVLQSYLLMFVHSAPDRQPNHDYESITEHAMNTYTLGEHVAPNWGLGKVVKWRPMNVGRFSVPLGPDADVPSILAAPGSENARSIGMYKVHGTTVEAVVGGVFHQFGGAVAHRLFHTRLLPHLCVEGSLSGLHPGYHAYALDVCENMGGREGPLLR